ncbi:hypothetical protein ACLOJK_014232 [Asimina triloba]
MMMIGGIHELKPHAEISQWGTTAITWHGMAWIASQPHPALPCPALPAPWGPPSLMASCGENFHSGKRSRKRKSSNPGKGQKGRN